MEGADHSVGSRSSARTLLTIAVFASIVAIRGCGDHLVLDLPLAAALVTLAFIDVDRRLLPNRIVYPLALWGIVATGVVATDDLVEHLVAGAAAFTFLLLAALAYPGGMGMGDVKLAGALGFYLGASVIPALVVAFLTGSLFGLGIMLREGSAARKKALPFGVFLALGGIVGILVGAELTEAYQETFLS